MNDHGFDFRPGTVDEDVFYSVVCQNEYRLPDTFHPTDIIIDIGAHIGCFAYACIVRGAGVVYCFEPDDENYSLARQHLSQFGDRAKVFNLAVWRSDEKRESVRVVPWSAGGPQPNTGSTFVSEELGTAPVGCISLDTIISNSAPALQAGEFAASIGHLELISRPSGGRVRTIRLVKIDAEGSEYPILFTSSQLHQCQEIVGEYHDTIPKHGLPGRDDYDVNDLKAHLEHANSAEFEGFAVETISLDEGRGLFFARRSTHRLPRSTENAQAHSLPVGLDSRRVARAISVRLRARIPAAVWRPARCPAGLPTVRLTGGPGACALPSTQHKDTVRSVEGRDGPLVSVVIPTFNQRQFLKQALDSVLHQTYRKLEVIVVNDGSTDDTERVLTRWENDRRVRIVPLKKNRGLPEALNIGFRRVHGEFCTWTSSDNVVHRRQIETLLMALNDNPDCGAAYSDFRLTGERRGAVRIGQITLERLLRFDHVLMPSFLFRRSALRRAGRFDAGLAGLEDVAFWAELFLTTTVLYVPRVLYSYRIHAGQASETIRQAGGYDALKQAVQRKFTERHGLVIPFAERGS